MRNQIKWLCIMTALSCLLIGACEAGTRIEGYLREKKEDGDIVISIDESRLQEERQELREGQKAGETGNRDEDGTSEKGNPEPEGTGENGRAEKGEGGEKETESWRLSWGTAGILKGSLGLARRILESRCKSQLRSETDTDAGNGALPREISDEEPGPPVMWLVSDLHYMSPASTDYGEAFEAFQARGDGKVMRYLPQILDSLLEEAKEAGPDVVILTGDITMNGEKINHEELAGRLSSLQDAGIQVLVIPGNHDINNPDAGVFFGDRAERTQEVTPEEFGQIYGKFGPDQAVSRDEESFSYVYALRDHIWLMLLDTAQYEPRNLVDGMVRPGTLSWMEENLRAAREQGIQVIVLGHHNLLSQSTMFTDMCVLENGKEVTELLERYQVPMYISGHLHLQRAKKHKREPSDEGYGIWEIVSDAVSIPPCQYGVVRWQENGDIHFYTRQTDVAAWALENGVSDENLLDFPAYGEAFIRQIIGDQIRKKTGQVREKTSEEMAEIYADVYAGYCAGLKLDQREAMRSWEYRQWQQCWPDSKPAEELDAMIRDSSKDYNYFILEGASH